jgi:hypothetical protein
LQEAVNLVLFANSLSSAKHKNSRTANSVVAGRVASNGTNSTICKNCSSLTDRGVVAVLVVACHDNTIERMKEMKEDAIIVGDAMIDDDECLSCAKCQ